MISAHVLKLRISARSSYAINYFQQIYIPAPFKPPSQPTKPATMTGSGDVSSLYFLIISLVSVPVCLHLEDRIGSLDSKGCDGSFLCVP